MRVVRGLIVLAALCGPAPFSAMASASASAPMAVPATSSEVWTLPQQAPMAAVRRHLAKPAGFAPHDFDLLINYRAPLPPAPSVVTALLRDPARSDTLLPALRAALREKSTAEFILAEGLWPWLDVTVHAFDSPVRNQARNQTVAATPAPSGVDLDPATLSEKIRNARQALHDFTKPLADAEQAYLGRELPPLFRPNAEDTALNPLERELERLRGEALTDSLLGLSRRAPLERLADATRGLDAVLAFVLDHVRNAGPEATVAVLQTLRAQGVPVLIGSGGSDTHRLREGIVFDPGGDDRYEFSDAVRPGTWLMVIDASGNDAYVARDSTGGAAAFLGVQMITDLSGDDVYGGRDFAFGSALLGFSRLFDAAGNDTYTGRSASLGFAFHGAGILQDRGGDDTYSSAYLSQGASSTFGFGLLLDEAGDDAYLSRPEFLDDLRYRDRFLTLSQGFSTGFAPQAGGGVAVLWDRTGNDRYTADIFGQGAGYWFAWGVLMDDEGHDSLKAYQYAQGAGVHFAVGTLLDGSGIDARVSKGVSQGCGHDGGFGLFADADGRDHNTAVDMSAGAGSANGLGVLVDFAGDDTYSMGNPAMTLGHGDMRRDRPSLGFFLDLGGGDVYPGVPEASGVSDDSGVTKIPKSSGDASETKDAGRGGGVKAFGMVSNRAHENQVWRVYDGVKRGHGFGMDAEVKP